MQTECPPASSAATSFALAASNPRRTVPFDVATRLEPSLTTILTGAQSSMLTAVADDAVLP